MTLVENGSVGATDQRVSAPAVGPVEAIDAPSTGARLLKGLRADGQPMSLAEHLAVHGGLPPAGPEVVERVLSSGLLGRGGAGFPLGVKLRVARESASSRRKPLVVVNAAESEPASRKDYVLVSRAPHLVLDGAGVAARAVGADEAVVWLHRGRPAMGAALHAAIAERSAAGLPDPVFRLVEGPSRYVSGQATAAVGHLAGREAMPMTTVVPMARRGLSGRPTLVSNAETLAHLALVHRHGPAWFRGVGAPGEPGTMLVTLMGSVRSPGVVEAAVGATVHELLTAAGGVIDEPVSALLVGGYAGSWLPYEQAGRAYSRAGLAPVGAEPGVGMVVVLPTGSCPVVETARLAGWLSDERVGQCGPCLNGLPALASAARSLAYGGPDAALAPEQLRRWAGMVEGRGACHHPDGVVRLVRSLLLGFPDDIARHTAGAPCQAALPAIVLPGRGDGGWR